MKTKPFHLKRKNVYVSDAINTYIWRGSFFKFGNYCLVFWYFPSIFLKREILLLPNIWWYPLQIKFVYRKCMTCHQQFFKLFKHFLFLYCTFSSFFPTQLHCIVFISQLTIWLSRYINNGHYNLFLCLNFYIFENNCKGKWTKIAINHLHTINFQLCLHFFPPYSVPDWHL